jgi:octanoyl-[GcvH]:protein N-octanoyltransferase
VVATGHAARRHRGACNFGRVIADASSFTKAQPEAAVALDSVLAQDAHTSPTGTIRIWENGRTVVLPSRLRQKAHGSISDSRGRPWSLFARGSGGGVVAHGPGVLNLSLIVPSTSHGSISIAEGYWTWVTILGDALQHSVGVTTSVGAVDGAFCRGAHDVVADGRKLAGVAQARRSGSAVLVHGTILREVNAAEYLGVVEAADRRAGLDPIRSYDPGMIVSLHELAGRCVDTQELIEAIKTVSGLAGDGLAEFPQLAELARARRLVQHHYASIHPHDD